MRSQILDINGVWSFLLGEQAWNLESDEGPAGSCTTGCRWGVGVPKLGVNRVETREGPEISFGDLEKARGVQEAGDLGSFRPAPSPQHWVPSGLLVTGRGAGTPVP